MEKLQDPRWQRKRLEIFERDSFSCLDCSSNTKMLTVHHCVYMRTLDPWDYPNDILMTLCDPCHVLRQGREEAARLALARELAKYPPQRLDQVVWHLLALTNGEAA